MTDLERKIQEADEAYYNTGTPIMSDQEYDALRAKIKSNKVGATPSGKLPQVKHDHLMLSLDKVHTIEEILSFATEEVVGMLKMDGLTISANYIDGKLTKLETRGNGEIGNDVMIHANSFLNLPKEIDSDIHSLTVDGECIITYPDFEAINEKLPVKDRFANPRNLASGTLNTLDPKVSAERRLRFIAWDVIELDGSALMGLENLLNKADFLGFDTVPRVAFNPSTDDIQACIDELKDYASRWKYPIDGLVFGYNNGRSRANAGKTSHHFKHSIAYKFEDDTYPTILRNIEWTMGKTGALTPVAVFDPVVIDGTEVARASMHNVSVMKELHPMIGGTVYVYKANQIIPQLHHCDDDGDEPELPESCPLCGEPTTLRKDKESVILACTNPSCSGKLLGRLSTFVSKNGMNIDGLSTEKLKFLIDKGMIGSYADIYELKQYRQKLEWQTSRWGPKSTRNLLNNIENSKHVKLDNFITALSLPNIGYSQAKLIAKKCGGDVQEFLTCLHNPGKLLTIDGIGGKTVADLRGWTKTGSNMEDVYALLKYLFFQTEEVTEVASDTLKGKIFCITGKLNQFANRDALVKDIESKGGHYLSSVSKKVDYLINNDKLSNTKKNEQAKKLGVTILTEDDYLRLANGETN